jgi:transposase
LDLVCLRDRNDPSFIAHLVTQKCMSSMPLYRLEKTFAHMGVPMARSTMNDLFYRAAQKLAPLRAVLLQAIRKDSRSWTKPASR